MECSRDTGPAPNPRKAKDSTTVTQSLEKVAERFVHDLGRDRVYHLSRDDVAGAGDLFVGVPQKPGRERNARDGLDERCRRASEDVGGEFFNLNPGVR